MGKRPDRDPLPFRRNWREACSVDGCWGGLLGDMAVAFDEMNGVDGQIRPAYSQLSAWLSEVRPDELDFRRREAEVLFRRIGITFAVYGEADATERLIPFDVIPRILSGSEWRTLQARPGAAGQGDQRLYQGHLRQARMPARRRDPRGSGVSEPGLPARNERPESAARHLRAYRRDRHRAGRCRHLLRAGRQRAHPVRRLLHAGEPGNHAAAVSGIVLAPPRRAGRQLPRRFAGNAAIGGADRLPRPSRPSCC